MNILSFAHGSSGLRLRPMSQLGIRFLVTANFTDDGAVAYRRADGTWSRQLADAGTFSSEAEAQPVAERAAAEEQREVADPYAIDVRVGAEGLEPTTARERIRAYGPTIPMRRPDGGIGRKPV